MSRARNTQLADMFTLTGWSRAELARLVNARAADAGHGYLGTDASRVRRWIEGGERPREPVPHVLAELFSEWFGRTVTPDDLGLGTPRVAGDPFDVDLPWEAASTGEAITEFTGMDLMLNRRGFVGAGLTLVVGPHVINPLQQWLSAQPGPARSGEGAERAGPGQLGEPEMAALENTVRVFRAWDADKGGGLRRKAVVGQLNEVGHLLSAAHPTVLTRRLWAVAADLAVLAGWMSHDVRLEPTAQKYFVLAVHAAHEAGDEPRAAEALTRMARQMVHLGKPKESLELVQLAQRGCGPEATATTRAMFHTVEAWANGAMGRSQDCHRALGEAEVLLTESKPAEEPEWIGFFDPADLNGMAALSYRTLAEHDASALRRAEQRGIRALELREQGRARSSAFDLISLASAYFMDGEPDRGAVYARLALAATRDMSSTRTHDRLRDMNRLTGLYRDVPAIRDLRDQLALTLTAGQV